MIIEERDTRFRHLEAKIGLFLALALAACLGAVFYIGAGSDLFTPKYLLHFTVDQGTGFAAGMPIKLSGFRIGRIQEIALNQDARVEIQVQIARKYQQWIRADSVARLVKEGLVGDEIIELSVGSSGQRMLEDGDRLNFEKTKSLNEHAAEIADKVKPVLMDVAAIIGYINDPEGDFKKSLRNIQILTGDLRTVRGEVGRQLTTTVDNLNLNISKIGTTLDHSQESFHAFEASLGKIDRAVGKVDDSLPGLLQRLDRTLGNFEQTSANLHQVSEENLPALLQRLDRILVNLEQTSVNLQQVSATAGPQIPELVAEVDSTVKEARQVIGAVQEIWLIRNNLPARKPLLVEGDSHE